MLPPSSKCWSHSIRRQPGWSHRISHICIFIIRCTAGLIINMFDLIFTYLYWSEVVFKAIDEVPSHELCNRRMCWILMKINAVLIDGLHPFFGAVGPMWSYWSIHHWKYLGDYLKHHRFNHCPVSHFPTFQYIQLSPLQELRQIGAHYVPLHPY